MEYTIDDLWPVSTEVVPNGGIGIDWSGPIGFGRFELFWGEDGKLHACTECLGKKFIKRMFDLLIEEIVIDE